MKQNSEVNKKQEAVLKAELNKMNQLKKCVAIASATPEGIIAFRQLMGMCAYNLSVVNQNPQTGEVNPIASLYNAARENIWKEFRQLIPLNVRRKIENEKTIYLDEGGE